MKTYRDLFDEWTELNPYQFQQTLFELLGHTLFAFNNIIDLPYITISNEMFDIMINSVSSARKRDNMRFLIMMLDRYLSETNGKEITHPSITDDQAVWMVLHEASALESSLIRERVQMISDADPVFEVLGAKYLVSLSGIKSPDTIAYRRKAINLCSCLNGCPVSRIEETEVLMILHSSPSWIHRSFKTTIKGIMTLKLACA